MDRNEAIEVIRKNYPHVSESGTQFETALRTLIPELKESEDERIRKIIIKWATYMSAEWIKLYGVTKEEVLAWLEKQGEQNPAWSEEDEKMLNKCIEYASNIVPVKAAKESGLFVDFKRIPDEKVRDWLKALKERHTWKPSDEHYELKEFAKIVRGNLTGISKDVQEKFEAKYLQLTGNKMYGGYKD